MVELIHLMGEREGFGDVLSDGVRIAAERIGRGSEKYAMHVKGLELPAYDVRGAKAHGLGYATSYTGADHNKGYSIQEIFGLPFPYAVDRFEVKGKGALTMWNQDARTSVGDCPTMCIFMLDTSVAPFLFENTAGLMVGATGLDFTADDVQRVGERVNNLARAFNTLAGLTRADDDLPERLKTEPRSSRMRAPPATWRTAPRSASSRPTTGRPPVTRSTPAPSVQEPSPAAAPGARPALSAPWPAARCASRRRVPTPAS